ncbi:hypothetical protein H0I23_09165 [Cellulophaga sp. HaHaR_3_176]|uniref:hypothetical protein n=1 Tax=Cellulophaga sp. HaHaR_3_176 TaxID=1942464 RepID=UPI001C1FB413|nr:hypothetical protein [Cellulophaga sp. HaHaR_3_176]QWX82637.1 hypothetical protein H0I23_09165 [Cellulophaga sp. HaHaR_3_176]
MDLGSAIIGSIFFVICIAPFSYIYFKGVKTKNNMLRSLNKIAQQHNSKISKHEVCGDFIIGLDEKTNFVYFLKQKKEETISQFVNLSEVQNCQAVKSTRNIKMKDKNVTVTDRVELAYMPINKDKVETKFELYREGGMQLNGEIQLVDAWSKQINNLIRA